MSWWSSEDAADRKADVQRDIERRRQRGEKLEPVIAPKGTKLASRFWGQAWQRHLEGFADYESRLPRGRSYLRQGQVYDLEIEEGVVSATVAGQSLYDVRITFDALKPSRWEAVRESCAGRVGSLLDLLTGNLGDEVLKVITDRECGLFPDPKEIHLNCNCPDYADLCKHSAAVLYAIGLRFDSEPSLFFKLRGVDQTVLVNDASKSLTSATADDASVIANESLGELFGIELDEQG